MNHKTIILSFLILLISLFFYLSCCDDCPTCPEPEEETPGNYRLYSLNWNDVIYSIDIPADTIIDSITLDYSGGPIYITPDGNRLLVRRYDYDSSFGWTEIYRTSDLTYIGSIPQYGDYHFDGGGNYGILKTREKIYFINPIDLSPIDSIEFNLPIGILIGHSYLDTTLDRFFCRTSPYIHSDSSSIIFNIDCTSKSLADSIIIPSIWGRIISIAYNGLTDDIYFHALRRDGAFLFQIYNITSDSLLNSIPITRVSGSITISPDGSHIYMTDGGDGMHGDPPIHPIWIIDALTRQPIHWIAPYDSTNCISPYFGQMVPTPDNRRIYICGNVPGIPIVVVDLNENRIINIIKPYINFGSIALGLGSK